MAGKFQEYSHHAPLTFILQERLGDQAAAAEEEETEELLAWLNSTDGATMATRQSLSPMGIPGIRITLPLDIHPRECTLPLHRLLDADQGADLLTLRLLPQGTIPAQAGKEVEVQVVQTMIAREGGTLPGRGAESRGIDHGTAGEGLPLDLQCEHVPHHEEDQVLLQGGMCTALFLLQEVLLGHNSPSTLLLTRKGGTVLERHGCLLPPL